MPLESRSYTLISFANSLVHYSVGVVAIALYSGIRTTKKKSNRLKNEMILLYEMSSVFCERIKSFSISLRHKFPGIDFEIRKLFVNMIVFYINSCYHPFENIQLFKHNYSLKVESKKPLFNKISDVLDM